MQTMNIQSITASWPNLVPVSSLKGKPWNGKNWDGVNWVLVEDWTVHVKAKDYEFYLTVRKGFVTDGGSIPQIVQNIFKAMGVYLLAYLIHDAMYGGELVARILADNILFDVLEFQGMTWIGREEVYSAVRFGGGFVWDNHTKASLRKAKSLIDFEWHGQIKSIIVPRISESAMNKYFPNKEVFNLTPANT